MERSISSLVAVLVVFLAACTPSTQTSGGSVPVRPQIEQRATLGYSQILDSLDPHALAVNARRYEIFDTLILRDDQGAFGPAIATAWSLVNPTTWQFTLRTDVPFHDGTMLTADDVKYSFERVLDPANKLGYSTRISTVAGVDIVDRATVHLRTKAPDPILLGRMVQIAIVPKLYAEQVGLVEFSDKPVGSGPFKVKDWSRENALTLVAHDGNPFRKATLRELTIRRVSEPAGRIAGLQSGEADYIDAVPIDSGQRLTSAGFGLRTNIAGSSLGFFMGTMYGDRPMDAPTVDKRVRQALNYAVDKESIARQFFGGLVEPEGQVAQQITFGYNPAVRAYPYDPKKAKELLVAAGYANGFKLRAEAPAYVAEFQPIGLLIQQNFRDIGIDLDIQLHPDVTTQADKVFGRFLRPPLLGIRLTNAPLFDASVPLNYFRSDYDGGPRMFSNPEFDRLYRAQLTELESAKRLKDLQQAMVLLHEDPPFLWLVPTVAISAFNPKTIAVDRKWLDADTRIDQAFQRVG